MVKIVGCGVIGRAMTAVHGSTDKPEVREASWSIRGILL